MFVISYPVYISFAFIGFLFLIVHFTYFTSFSFFFFFLIFRGSKLNQKVTSLQSCTEEVQIFSYFKTDLKRGIFNSLFQYRAQIVKFTKEKGESKI